MASQVGIVNSALIKLGADTITAMGENSKEARRANAQWDKLRQEVLRGHPWNFAKGRAALAALAEDPAFGWGKQFQLPADCLRALYLDDGEGRPLDVAWEIEGRKLLTNEAEANLAYIRDVTDTGAFDAYFSEALALRLAADLAYDMSGTRTMMESMMTLYRDHLRMARLIDAQESNNQAALRAETWLNARGS